MGILYSGFRIRWVLLHKIYQEDKNRLNWPKYFSKYLRIYHLVYDWCWSDGIWIWYMNHLNICCWLWYSNKWLYRTSYKDQSAIYNWMILLSRTLYIDADTQGADVTWITDITTSKRSWFIMVLALRKCWWDGIKTR